jgi:hypothetical protein
MVERPMTGEEHTMTDQVLDKTTVKKIATDAQAALEAVAAKYGMKVTVGGGSYFADTGEFKPKVSFKLDDPDAERREFEVKAPLIWCDAAPDASVLPSDYGLHLKNGGKTYRLVGLNHRAPKYPFIVEDVATGAKMRLGQTAIRTIITARLAQNGGHK